MSNSSLTPNDRVTCGKQCSGSLVVSEIPIPWGGPLKGVTAKGDRGGGGSSGVRKELLSLWGSLSRFMTFFIFQKKRVDFTIFNILREF